MNRIFQILLDTEGQKNHVVLIRNYAGIKLAIPYQVSVQYYRQSNTVHNTSEEDDRLSMHWFRYATTHIGEYFPEKIDEDMFRI